MPNEKKAKSKCVEYLRHAEYYDMQSTFDELYARSQAGEIFENLMDVILSRENILLAYRNIKSNTGSITPGTDKLKISDIGKLTADEVTARVRKIVKGAKNGYTPRSVRRKDIPKPNGNTRPLGIPCIWDRLVQQCIKQVMEPICEARFSNNSYGFRPNRSVENAIAATYRLMQKSGLQYVVEFDIKGFFDNVDHSKLIKQLWSLNIRDKELLYVIRRILKAPILMPDGHTEHPTKGTPQGGIISPLLANVVLNELDHWIESQWQCNPVTENYAYRENAAGCPIQSHAYRAMRNTRLKEMYIVRYADDFRILCRTREQADRTLIAVTQWLKERLRLDVSPEKTRVVDVRRSYSEFLGFKIRLRKKGKKYVVQSHMCDKAYKKVKASLTKQVGNIKFPRKGRGEAGEVRLFNSMVMGIQNYYQLATDISIDCGDIGRTVNTVLKNRLKSGKTHRLKKEGRDLTKMEIQRYGKSEQLRYIAQSKEPIYPISYVQCKNPMSQRRKVCAYTAAGRSEIHDDLRINTFLLLQLMRAPTYSRSTEYADNRISLFSAQWGKCAVTGKKFQCISEIHCHHKKPKGIGGRDKYENLVLVLAPVHELIHAVDEDTIRSYLTADFILSLCELIVGGKEGLQPVQKTIIDRCVRLVYNEYLNDPKPENMPILEDLYNLLREQEEKEAQYIATALEIYVTGSLNVFNHQSNVDIDNRIVCYDIKELGKQLKKIGMLVVQDQVWNRVTINRAAHKSTRYYIDEMHLLLKEEQTAAYTVEIWKRFRKWGGIPTGITQNVKDLLSSREVENIFENSDFVYMLNQAGGDRQILAKQLGISTHQLSYVTHSGEGEGLLFYGSTILPFVDHFPKNTELYRIRIRRK